MVVQNMRFKTLITLSYVSGIRISSLPQLYVIGTKRQKSHYLIILRNMHAVKHILFVS